MARRVLVIDDEDDIREVAQLSLEMTTDWEIVTASSGAGGIEAAARDRPDAILLDVMMPDMDGPTTFAELRADPATAQIPVILLTAKAQASDRARFLELGVNGVLTKPFDPLTLGADVAAALGWAP
jgi:two-component system, OmpR family, alkaline phosphatase synthesis response regulator PhoP